MAASLESLPNEMLARIVSHLPTYGKNPMDDSKLWREPIPPPLFLINKRLCHAMMDEQVRELNFRTNRRLSRFMRLHSRKQYSNDTLSTHHSYWNLIQKTTTLAICFTKDMIPSGIKPDHLLTLIKNTPALKKLTLSCSDGNSTDNICQPILQFLPRGIRSLRLDYIDITVKTFDFFIHKSLPHLQELYRLHWATSEAIPFEDKDEKSGILTFDLLQRAPQLIELELDILEVERAFGDNTVDAAAKFCPHLVHLHFEHTSKVTNEKILDWLNDRGQKILSLDLGCRVISDHIIERISFYCPHLRELHLQDTYGTITTKGLKVLLDRCHELKVLEIPDISELEDPVWELCLQHKPQLFGLEGNAKMVSGPLKILGTNIAKLKNALGEVWHVIGEYSAY